MMTKMQPMLDRINNTIMNKLYTISFLLFLLLTVSCKSQNYKGTKNVIIPSITSYIEHKNEKTPIDSKKNIIVIGANTEEDNPTNKNLNISFYFINPKLLLDFKYSKVYEIKGYNLIISEDLNKSEVLKYAFKDFEIPYENFNLGKIPFSYNTDYWRITLNNKNEIVEILPQEKSEEIKSLLEKKGVKFSKDYVD